MRFGSWVFALLALGGSALGCGREGAPGGERPALCPTCTPSVGGETSDFGGGSACSFDAVPLGDETALAFHVDELAAAYRGAFEETLRWQATDAAVEIPGAETTIRVSVALGDAQHFVSRSVDCPDFVAFDAIVALETTDGALSAAPVGALSIQSGDALGAVSAQADLADARGDLDLGIDTTRPHVGRVRVAFQASPEGLTGSITPELLYFADRESAEAYARGADTENEFESNVVGVFPADPLP